MCLCVCVCVCAHIKWSVWRGDGKCPSHCQTTRTKKLCLPRISLYVLHTHTQAGRQTQTYTAEPSSFSYSLQQQHLVGVGKSNTKLWVTGWKTSQLNLQDPFSFFWSISSLSLYLSHSYFTCVCNPPLFFLLQAKLDRLRVIWNLLFLLLQQQQQRHETPTRSLQTNAQQQLQQHCNSIRSAQ